MSMDWDDQGILYGTDRVWLGKEEQKEMGKGKEAEGTFVYPGYQTKWPV
jgi:hypothetical protein